MMVGKSAGGSAYLLDVEGLTFAYPGHQVTLDDVSFTVSRGELITLLGPNGAGKSTLLNCIMHLLQPQAGTIVLNGTELSELSQRDIACTVSYVPQTTTVNFAYSVRDYVALGRAPYLKMYERPGEEDLAKVDAALARLGIADMADRVFNELSGGQQQLVNVSRAIAQDPQLMLFDEPTSALDYGNQIKVLKMIKELSSEEYAIIMTTHNPDHPILLESEVCLIEGSGHLVKGANEQIMREDRLRNVYQADLIIDYIEQAQRRVCMTGRL